MTCGMPPHDIKCSHTYEIVYCLINDYQAANFRTYSLQKAALIQGPLHAFMQQIIHHAQEQCTHMRDVTILVQIKITCEALSDMAVVTHSCSTIVVSVTK